MTAAANLHMTGLVAGLPDLDPISDGVYVMLPAVEGPCKAPLLSDISSAPFFLAKRTTFVIKSSEQNSIEGCRARERQHVQ